MRVWWAFGLTTLTILLAAGGLALVLWALYGALAPVVGASAAGVLTGLSALAAAGGCAWIAQRIIR